MENETLLIQWLLLNGDALNMTINKLDWISKPFPDLTDVNVTIKINGEDSIGFGASENKDLALQKSFAEAIERIVFREHGLKTTNGFAAHIDWERSSRSAVAELMERDYFLCHFYSNQPFTFRKLSAKSFSLVSRVQNILAEMGVSLEYYALGKSGILCVIDGRFAKKPFGFILGSAQKPTELDSVVSATIEAVRQFYFHLSEGAFNSLSLDEFKSIEKPGFPEHGKLALNLDYAAQIAYLFDRNGKAHPEASEIKVEQITSQLPELASCPLVFARASSAMVQDLFVGLPKPEKMNLKRLSEFAGQDLTFEQLCPLPHPFN